MSPGGYLGGLMDFATMTLSTDLTCGTGTTAVFDNTWHTYLGAQAGINIEQEPMSEPKLKPEQKPEPTEFQKLSNHQFHELLGQFEKLLAH